MADEIRNWEPSLPALNRLARAMRVPRDYANRAQVPSWVPIFGGEGLGDLIIGQSPEEIERWSYGDLPMRVPELSNVPVVKTGRKGPLADIVGLALDSGSIAKSGAKLASRGALRGSDAAVRAITGNPEATAMRVIEETRLPTPASVMKNKGGNWMLGSVEQSVAPMYRGVNIDALQQLRRQNPAATEAELQRQLATSGVLGPEDTAINQWLDKKLANYIRNEMATPEDPLRELAGRGVSHMPLQELERRGNAQIPLSLEESREYAGFPGSGLEAIRYAKQGYPTGAAEESALRAMGWEHIADTAIGPAMKPGELAETPSMYQRALATNPWLAKVDPESNVYGFGQPASAGFRHLADELRNAINPESGLPPELLWKYSDLNKVSVPQAVERVAKINEWRAAQNALADASRARNPATQVFKEYPEQGYSWVELRKPEGADDVKSLEDALKYEGDTMGHCVGGYCPDVEAGYKRIFSLRDKKGQPHVTIEVRPGKQWNQRNGIFYDNPDLEAPWKEYSKETFKKHDMKLPNDYIVGFPDWLKVNDPEVYTAHESVFAPSPPDIFQIKGKGNRAPKEEYLPAVQDFIRSQKWGGVGDLENTGLIYVSPDSDIAGALRRAGEEVPDYVSQQELTELRRRFSGDEGFAAGGNVQHYAKGGIASKIAKTLAEMVETYVTKESDDAAKSGIRGILESKQPPATTPQGTGLPLMPRDAGMYTPDVPQVDLPRQPGVDKARAQRKSPKYTERMQDLLDSPTARRKVNRLIEKGEDLGMREWYGTEPMRQVALNMGMPQEKFDELLAQLASASQRNPVDQQNRMGSYLWHMSQTGQLPDDAFLLTNKLRSGKATMPEGSPIELPPGYGSLAQGDIFERGLQISRGDIAGALPPERKLGTFYRNLQGNLRPVTVDVNAVRGPIIESGDPRWLVSKLVEKDEEGRRIAEHFPRKAVEAGEMTIKEAKARPGFWEAAPSGSEYAGFEDLWQRAAKRYNIEPAEAQALGWYGSGDVTALKTKPELYIDNLERLIRRTAEQTGEPPLRVLEDFISGQGYLKKKGGLVKTKYAEGGVVDVDYDPERVASLADQLESELFAA